MILLIISPRVNSSRTKKNKKLKWLKVYRKQVNKKKKEKDQKPSILARVEITEKELPMGTGHHLCDRGRR